MQGFLTGLALLLGFALPPLLQLKNVPALRVIRRDVGPPQQSALAAYGLGAAAVAALLVWQAGDTKLGLIVLGGFGAGLLVFGGRRLRRAARAAALAPVAGSSWRYGLANLRRRARDEHRADRRAQPRPHRDAAAHVHARRPARRPGASKTPPDAPNRFIVNIQPEQREPLQTFFAESRIAAPTTYPMVRGRYVALNGKPVDADAFKDRERRLVEREFNLSFMTDRCRRTTR